MNTLAFTTGAPLLVKPVSSTSTVCSFSTPNVRALRRSSFLPNTSQRLDAASRLGHHATTPAMTLSLDKGEQAIQDLMEEKMYTGITEEEVIAAQQLWADGVVKIGSLKDKRSACEAYADQFLSERYAFDIGTVMFKPTKCAVVQFRPTKADAVSYFIGGANKQHAEDGGFAVTPWTHVRFQNAHVLLEGERAIAMGNYFFTDTSGGVTKVEYTFGYKKVDGGLKIDLHHSSIPFPSPSN